MNVPLLDLSVLYRRHKEEIQVAIDRVLEHHQFILGPEVEAFEDELAAYLGDSSLCIGTSSGTSALLLSLWALGVGPGDEVILPAYSFIATAMVVVRAGATPVFVDVEPEALNLDSELIAEKITDRTRAIIAVHLFGRAAELDKVAQAASQGGGNDIAIIEDAAQSLSARYRGQMLGTCGDLGCYSFFPSKNLGSFGDGGAVVTSNRELADKVKSLRKHGATRPYYHEHIGLNGRLDALQAAILRARLPHLDSWTDERRANADCYRELFDQTGLLEHVGLPTGDGSEFFHVYNQFCLSVRDGRRDQLKDHLSKAGIGSAIYYPIPMPFQPCFHKLGHRTGDFPVSEQAASQNLAIPVYPGLSTDAQEFVIETIEGFFKKVHG